MRIALLTSNAYRIADIQRVAITACRVRAVTGTHAIIPDEQNLVFSVQERDFAIGGFVGGCFGSN